MLSFLKCTSALSSYSVSDFFSIHSIDHIWSSIDSNFHPRRKKRNRDCSLVHVEEPHSLCMTQVEQANSKQIIGKNPPVHLREHWAVSHVYAALRNAAATSTFDPTGDHVGGSETNKHHIEVLINLTCVCSEMQPASRRMDRREPLRIEANSFYKLLLQQAAEAPSCLETNMMLVSGDGQKHKTLLLINKPECLSLLTNHLICQKTMSTAF